MKIDNGDKEKFPRTEHERSKGEQPRKRIPFGVPRAKMAVLGEIPGWELAYINDEAGRIEEAQLGGYEFVGRGEITLAVGAGAGVTPDNSDLGDRISMIVGRTKQGGPLRAYLMKIRKEHKEENRQLLREMRDKRWKSIERRGGASGEEFYVPGTNPFNQTGHESPIKVSRKD